MLIAVRDNGIGIEPDMTSRVFELFIQGAARRSSRSTGGLGIGLALARRLVEMHGGQLDLRSDGAGHGSEFSCPAAAPGHGARDAAHRQRSSEPPLTDVQRILVVDDNQDSAEMLAALLTAWGQQTRVALRRH